MTEEPLIWGRTPTMLELMRRAEACAAVESPVLIEGPPGSGKSVLANTIHVRSARRGPWVECSLPGIAPGLRQATVFGHVRGAFTGAVCTRTGLLEEAQGGTLFLDEIGHASIEMQAMLLSVCESREFRRVGENRPRQADARIIAATNAQLGQMVAEGRFLEDLLHRFGYFRLRLPSLMERPEDIIPLFRRFLAAYLTRKGIHESASIAPEVCQLLESAPWPMNIRGVKSAAEFAAATLGSDQTIQIQHLPPGLIQESHSAQPGRRTLERRTRRLSQLMAALETVGGDLAAAARLLDIHPRTVYKILGRRRELTGNLSLEVCE